jgi:hypothetical protein
LLRGKGRRVQWVAEGGTLFPKWTFSAVDFGINKLGAMFITESAIL